MVDWTSNQAYPHFKLWRKEVKRILNGPLADKEAAVKLNHIYIWAGAHAETLVKARVDEDPDVNLDTPTALLDLHGKCLTHSTFLREAREDFYNMKQKAGENTTAYYARIMALYTQADFPRNSDFLIVDKLIHGCINLECKRKPTSKEKDVPAGVCKLLCPLAPELYPLARRPIPAMN